MAKKPERIHHGLADDKRPVVLNKASGGTLVAQTELAQLQDKREKLATQLDELDTQILDLKKKRHDELMEELHALGLDIPKTTVKTASTTEGGKKRGRAKGSTLSPEVIQRMKDGRAKAKAEREAKAGRKTSEPELPMDTEGKESEDMLAD